MRIIIKGTNIKLSPNITSYVEQKIGGLEKFLKGIDSNLIEARVEVGKIIRGQRQGDLFRAEVNLNLGGQMLRVEKTEEALMAAIDLVKDELAEEIKQFKHKRKDRVRRGARSWKKFWRLNPLARFRFSKVAKILRKEKK